MDILTNKTYENYSYTSRYENVPYYYNTVDKRYIYGIGTQLSKDTASVLHTLTDTDTLDSLALKYYNNPTYWWVIAYFNDIQDSFEPLKERFTTLYIPNIASINFDGDRS